MPHLYSYQNTVANLCMWTRTGVRNCITVKVLFCAILSYLRKSTAVWEVPRIHPLVFLARATCR